MRVLFVTQSHPKYEGDATAPFIAAIARALAERGHEIDVVLPFHPELRYPESERIRFFPFRYSPVPSFAPWGYGAALRGGSGLTAGAALVLPLAAASLRRSVRRLLASRSYDVVHAHWVLPNGWLVAGPARARGVPLVISLHGSDVAIAERNGLSRSAARHAFEVAGAVTACSEDLRRRAEALGAEPATTRTVHYGVDTEAFAPREPDPAMRARLGAPPGKLLVVAVGRLVEKKGFRYLLDAAARSDGVHVAFVGDGDLRSELEARARATQAPATFAGNLDHDEVGAALAAADVVAVPSVVDDAGNVDGLPNTLLEALAAGKAVVATTVAGIPEVVTDGENGLLVPQRDVGALSCALAALQDGSLREKFGAEARRRTLAERAWDATARGLEAAFETARLGRPL